MQQPNLKKNYLYRVFYEVLVVITPFITTPYISRVLEADGVGIYSYSASFMAFFTMFAALGTSGYGTREIAQNRDDRKKTSKLFWEIEILTIFTSSACLVVWIAFSLIYTEYKTYLLALTPLLLGTMFDINWFFTGHEKVAYTVLRNTFVKILGIVLLFTLVKTKEDLILYILIHSITALLGSLSMWTYLPKMLVKINFRTLSFSRHFKETLIYFIPTIATSIYTILDKTLIGLITHDDFQNGYYEQATKIIQIVKTLVFTSVNAVMGARMSYLFLHKRYDEIKDKIHKSLDFILLLGYGCLFGIIGVAQNFVPAFLGDGYDEVVQLLYSMTPLIIIIGISNCLGNQYYTPSGQRARSAKVIVLGACINLILNLVLIPTFKSQGAVIASVIAELSITALYVRMSDGYLTAADIIKSSWKRVLAGIVMCAVVILLGHIQLNMILKLAVQISIGVAVYFGLLMIMSDVMLKNLINQGRNAIKHKFTEGK